MSATSLDLTFPFCKERVILMLLDLERNPIVYLFKKKDIIPAVANIKYKTRTRYMCTRVNTHTHTQTKLHSCLMLITTIDYLGIRRNK